jgi:hypothetical protein
MILYYCEFLFKVISEIKYDSSGGVDLDNSQVHYGLFDGKMDQKIFQSTKIIDLTSKLMYFIKDN